MPGQTDIWAQAVNSRPVIKGCIQERDVKVSGRSELC